MGKGKQKGGDRVIPFEQQVVAEHRTKESAPAPTPIPAEAFGVQETVRRPMNSRERKEADRETMAFEREFMYPLDDRIQEVLKLGAQSAPDLQTRAFDAAPEVLSEIEKVRASLHEKRGRFIPERADKLAQVLQDFQNEIVGLQTRLVGVEDPLDAVPKPAAEQTPVGPKSAGEAVTHEKVKVMSDYLDIITDPEEMMKILKKSAIEELGTSFEDARANWRTMVEGYVTGVVTKEYIADLISKRTKKTAERVFEELDKVRIQRELARQAAGAETAAAQNAALIVEQDAKERMAPIANLEEETPKTSPAKKPVATEKPKNLIEGSNVEREAKKKIARLEQRIQDLEDGDFEESWQDKDFGRSLSNLREQGREIYDRLSFFDDATNLLEVLDGLSKRFEAIENEYKLRISGSGKAKPAEPVPAKAAAVAPVTEVKKDQEPKRAELKELEADLEAHGDLLAFERRVRICSGLVAEGKEKHPTIAQDCARLRQDVAEFEAQFAEGSQKKLYRDQKAINERLDEVKKLLEAMPKVEPVKSAAEVKAEKEEAALKEYEQGLDKIEDGVFEAMDLLDAPNPDRASIVSMLMKSMVAIGAAKAEYDPEARNIIPQNLVQKSDNIRRIADNLLVQAEALPEPEAVKSVEPVLVASAAEEELPDEPTEEIKTEEIKPAPKKKSVRKAVHRTVAPFVVPEVLSAPVMERGPLPEVPMLMREEQERMAPIDVVPEHLLEEPTKGTPVAVEMDDEDMDESLRPNLEAIAAPHKSEAKNEKTMLATVRRGLAYLWNRGRTVETERSVDDESEVGAAAAKTAALIGAAKTAGVKVSLGVLNHLTTRHTQHELQELLKLTTERI